MKTFFDSVIIVRLYICSSSSIQLIELQLKVPSSYLKLTNRLNPCQIFCTFFEQIFFLFSTGCLKLCFYRKIKMCVFLPISCWDVRMSSKKIGEFRSHTNPYKSTHIVKNKEFYRFLLFLELKK